jgi:rubrerythrin
MNDNAQAKAILISQLRNETTEAAVYARLAQLEKNPKNKEILSRISADEATHARIISDILGCEVQPSAFKIAWIVFCARTFGVTFTLKLMERGENTAGKTYRQIHETYIGIVLFYGANCSIFTAITTSAKERRELLALF